MTERSFIFQAKDWRCNQEYEKDDNECIITVGGVLENGEDIVCEIYGFQPSLVLELPTHVKDEEIEWTEDLYDKIYEWCRNLFDVKSNKRNIYKRPVRYEVLNDYKIYQKLRKGCFIRLYFLTHIACAGFRNKFEDKVDDVWNTHSLYCNVFQCRIAFRKF